MRPNISKFRIYEESAKSNKYWANYADENVLLVTHNKVKPWVDLTDPVVQYISTAMPSLQAERTPLMSYLKQTARTRTIDADWVKWKLRGTGKVEAIQTRNLNEGVATPGIRNTEFPIELDVEYYVEGDIIAPEVAKDIQVIVQDLPNGSGTRFVYTCVLVDSDGRSFFPQELLEQGLKWVKIGSAYGEASRGYGSTQFSGMSYIEFQSDLTDYGKQVEVTNKAHAMNLRLQSCDKDGKPVEDYPDQIISYIEAEFLAQKNMEIERMTYYGRSSGKQIIDKSTGYHKRIGPGLLEFLEDGNVMPYPLKGGSIDMFTEYLQGVWFDRVSPDKRNIKVYTGQGGLTLWKDWMLEKFGASAIQADFDTFVKKDGPNFGGKYQGLSLGNAHFTKLKLFPFGEIEVEHWPILDSTELNGSITHPDTGLPLSSYEFIVLDYGIGTGDNSNIELLEREDSEVYTYECGTWSPAGPINGPTGRNGFVSTGPQRSYILRYAKTFGIRVKDVTLTAHFVPAVQY